MQAHPVEAVIDGQREAARLVHQVRPPAAQLQHLRDEPGVADLQALRAPQAPLQQHNFRSFQIQRARALSAGLNTIGL